MHLFYIVYTAHNTSVFSICRQGPQHTASTISVAM